MYVDETGTPSHRDSQRYFLLTGVIIHENDVKGLKKTVFDFKLEHFSNGYVESELHMHDMFRSKNDFVGLKKEEKGKLIEDVYRMLNKLPFTAIGAAIHKPKFKQERPKWKVLKTALIVLVAKYNQFLESRGESEMGIIRMDKSTDKQRREVNEIFIMLKKEKKNNQIRNIIGMPYFMNSDAIEGIQVADVISFCIGKKLVGNPRFPIKYWDLIKDKILTNDQGEIMGKGLSVIPYIKEFESEDIQP